MGQQQLLLLVIGVILVALAVMAAFPALERGYRQDEADALLDRGLAITGYAVQWKITNDPFNGGNQSYERLAGAGLQTLGLDSTTVRGRFRITDATPNTLEVTGVSDRYEGIAVRVFINQYDVVGSDVSFNGEISLDDEPEGDN
ncbi:hypothetical protein [Rubrivirga sp. IMCC43871]|uniref:hypothetical protein n=1 Tax=Rubrivirga sp. IMCC43871 TaxID=3391575 RepID=UPI00398FCF33